MDEIREAVIHSCDMEEITDRVISMLPGSFMDDVAIKAAEEIVAEMG